MRSDDEECSECDDKYDEGHSDGYDEGLYDGKQEGYTEGVAEAADILNLLYDAYEKTGMDTLSLIDKAWVEIFLREHGVRV